ncbi:Calx-beta domain-containing protein [Actinoplanes sp. CA-054009]
MRYSTAHAATSGSVPFMLRGPKSVRRALSVAVAAAIGLTPAVMVASPALADPDDAISIQAVSAEEGQDLAFSVVFDNPVTAASYSFKVVAGDGVDDSDVVAATAGSDYATSPSPSSANVLATGGTKAVNVRTIDDNLFETPEALRLQVVRAGEVVAEAIGTITDNDNAPSYTLTGPEAAANDGAANAKSIVTAKLDAPAGVPVKIALTTQNGTATVATQVDDDSDPDTPTVTRGDFVALPGDAAITIPAGKLTGTYDIAIRQDKTKDLFDLEDFTVNGVGDNVASPANRAVKVQIQDGDELPKATITSPGSFPEDEGAVNFPVRLDHPSEKPVTVRWDAVPPKERGEDHGLATQGADFLYPAATQRVANIAAFGTSGAVVFTPKTDGIDELPEDLGIQLTSPTNAQLGADSMADATILDAADDAPPTLDSITPDAVPEGNAGTAPRTFTATLSAASGRPVTLDWATAPKDVGIGFATPGRDFISKKGKLTFPPGVKTATFSVDVVGDIIDEGAGEEFSIALDAGSDSGINISSTPSVDVTITDDDNAPKITLADVEMPEGNTTVPLLIPIKLSNPSDHPIQVRLDDENEGTATPVGADSDDVGNNDYSLNAVDLVIQPGSTSGFGVGLVNGDMINEKDETATFSVTPAAGTDGASWVDSPSAVPMHLKLINDDKAPELVVQDVTGAEGDSVSVEAKVVGQADTDATFTVGFAGASVKGHKAAEPNDFMNPGPQTVILEAGTEPDDLVAIADVPLNKDDVKEPDETIAVTGTALGGFGTFVPGAITITGEVIAPTPTISAPAASTGTAAFNITGKVAPNATVELWGAAGDAKLAWIANVKANASGNYTFSRSINRAMRFVTQSQLVNSKEITVTVNRGVTLTATSPSAGRVAVTVKTSPNAAGKKVVVQRWTGPNTWTNILVSKANVNGAYAAVTTAPKGTIALRSWVEGDSALGINTGWSAVVRPVIK